MPADYPSFQDSAQPMGFAGAQTKGRGKSGNYRFGRQVHGRTPESASAGEVGGGQDPRRPLGRRGEDQVLAHYRRLGFRLLASNQHVRFAELDLVVFDGHTLVFVEVKTRHTRAGVGGVQRYERTLGLPSARQSRGLRRAARGWMGEQGSRLPRASEIRFDVVRVLLDQQERLVCLDQVEAAA